MQSTIFALWETKIGAGIDEPIIDEPIIDEPITEETMVEFAKRCQKKGDLPMKASHPFSRRREPKFPKFALPSSPW